MSGLGSRRRSEFDRIKRQLGLSFLALVTVIVVGSIGYLIIGGPEHGIIDAVYMTVITLTTVGFGEVIDMTNNPTGRIFTLGLIFVGMGVVAYSVPLVAAFLIEGNLRHIFAGRRMQKHIESLSGHYIVCGDSEAAWHVVEELVKTRRPVVLIVPDDAAHARAIKQFGDIPLIEGDPSRDESLSEAGITRADGIVAAMNSDKENVLIVLTARRLSATVRIVASTEQSGINEILTSAGANAVVDPSRIGGLRMASEMVRPTVVSFLDKMLRDKASNLRVEEVRVPENSSAIGKTLDSLKVSDVSGAVLLAVQRPGEDFFFKPPPDTEVSEGMILIVMADEVGRSKLESRLTRSSSLLS